MPIETETTAIVAQDGYDEYYAEKLWNWIPAVYRDEDAYTQTPGTLRAIVEGLGQESADLRRFLDRIWDNAFIELADDDVLAALGEIVATRMLSELNTRGQRVNIARTIFYRRRKGTPRVLESLVSDIANWTGAHLESRKRLARAYHLLEPAPDPSLARFTQTPRGGWANLRSGRIPALAWTAFEELSHTPDFRRHRGEAGRYGVPKVNVHLHRARAFELNFPTAVLIGSSGAHKYTLDPSGRATPLFAPAVRPSAQSWERVREWQMPKDIDCRLLDNGEYEWTDAELDFLADNGLGPEAITLLEKYAGRRVRSLRALMAFIESFNPSTPYTQITTNIALFLTTVMVSDCGRAALFGDNQALSLALGPTTDALTSIERWQYRAGELSTWGATWTLASVLNPSALDTTAIVDPARGAVMVEILNTDPIHAPVLHYGFPGEVGAGSYDRRASIETTGVFSLPDGGNSRGPINALGLTPGNGVEQLENSKTYKVTQATISGITDYRLQAANFQRPYLLYSVDTVGTVTWTLGAAVKGVPSDLRCLVLEGLWIGLEDLSPVVQDLSSNEFGHVEGRLVLTGTWDRVEINHCTLDTGGRHLHQTPDSVTAIPYVTLEIQGFVEELIIDRSIVGPIIGTNSSLDGCSVGKIIIRDSAVLRLDNPLGPAIDVDLGELHIERSTILGSVTANRAYVSDSLILGLGAITDRQNGCFRFSAAGETGAWPHPYESYFFPISGAVMSWLANLELWTADFLRLTELTPIEIRAGAENHCEMGVWNHLFDEVRRADLRAKLGEFMPFDLVMQLVTEN